MSDDELNAIEARANAATPGPWEADGADVTTRYTSHSKGLVRWQVASYVDPRDLDFIVHAREDVPALVAEVRRLRGIEQEMEDLIERECRAPVCELEAENEALRKRVAETNDAIMRLVPMHTPGGTVAEKIAAYIEQLKRDRDSAIDRKWLDDAAREKCRVLQLAAKHSRRVAELEAQVQECHEWADTNQCWQDIAEIFGPRKGAPQ